MRLFASISISWSALWVTRNFQKWFSRSPGLRWRKARRSNFRGPPDRKWEEEEDAKLWWHRFHFDAKLWWHFDGFHVKYLKTLPKNSLTSFCVGHYFETAVIVYWYARSFPTFFIFVLAHILSKMLNESGAFNITKLKYFFWIHNPISTICVLEYLRW